MLRRSAPVLAYCSTVLRCWGPVPYPWKLCVPSAAVRWAPKVGVGISIWSGECRVRVRCGLEADGGGMFTQNILQA